MEQSHEPRDGKQKGDTRDTTATTRPQEGTSKLVCLLWDKKDPAPGWLVSFAESNGTVVSLQHRTTMAFIGVHGTSVFLSQKLNFNDAARFSLCKITTGPFAGLLRLWHISGGFFCVGASDEIVIAGGERAEGSTETMLLNSLWRLERCGEAIAFRNMWSGGLLAPQ
jgi:hypothetical protein